MKESQIKAILTVLGGAVIYFLGGWDVALRALMIFMVLDYATGVIRAWYQKQLNSYVGFRGIVKKVALLVVVAVAAQIDLVTGDTGAARSVAIMFLAANEGLSILENLAGMDVPIPPAVKVALASWKTQDEPPKDGEKA